ncbi:MAG: FAD-dependent oxidoreductase [Anaerolineales bacterium]|nr:FAD-dependent oxidoreductase [Anaerolineales bacterium]HJN41394.1 FAD-dependent oxidoreductase [Anaerolineales bacterium]
MPYGKNPCQKDVLPQEFVDDTGDLHFVPAPCQVACPIGTDAPSYLAHIWEGDFEGALEVITATNPLSSICGRVCDAPCEPACRRTDSDGPIAIRNLKRFIMDKLGNNLQPSPLPVTQKETVAIVGGGPTGLTAAQDLAEAGYGVHLYEMTDRLGGMAIWGIPAFRLPVDTINEDIDRILHYCPGIKVHLNCALGRDVSLDELKQRHEAVMLAIGAWWGKKMDLPGEDDPKVMDGVTFLREVNEGARPTMPETVVVVGAGDVSMDACRVAKRLPGCKTVKVVYRRGPNEIPARCDELEGAIKEGVEFVYMAQPIEIIRQGEELILRCLKTELGEPEEDGRRQPLSIPGSEHDFSCGMILAAVGQKAASEELEKRGMVENERVTTDFSAMLTSTPGVFGAGDGSFGPSTLVNAIYHGHRVAYYVKAYLEGREDPLPYRTPYKTRHVPVSQDPMWEIFSSQEQAFHGLGENPVEFPEIESVYDFESARKEAARCFRCDAETGTSEYSVRNREDIFLMARTEANDHEKLQSMFNKKLIPRGNPFPEGRSSSLDDIHFLPANLSRLVIDPYREDCSTETVLGKSLKLKSPFLATGFDDAPRDVREGLAQGLATFGCPYIGGRPLNDHVAWLQPILCDEDEPSTQAAGLIYSMGAKFVPIEAERLRYGQLLGIIVTSSVLEEAISYALEENFDLLILDATSGIGKSWPEMKSIPDLTVMRDTVNILRRLKQEENLSLIYFGGIRSGTDAAKVLAAGCDSVVMGVSLGLSLGGRNETDSDLQFYGDLTIKERQEYTENFLKACTGEVSMMARCTGKTNIHNLEPEDLRSITLASSVATGIPLAGT